LTTSHDVATCPAFGGCDDCRSAKFEATSPDVDYDFAIKPQTDPVDYSAVHAFNAAADATMARAGATSNQRAGEYLDTWALEGQNTPFLDDALRAAALGADIGRAEKRLILVAALCDVKLSRMGGGWKEDTCLDLLNYVSAYTSWREARG
jgi:hypothetical protein